MVNVWSQGVFFLNSPSNESRYRTQYTGTQPTTHRAGLV